MTKVSPDGSSLAFSTFLGGTDYDFSGAMALGPSGSVFTSGATASTGFPTTPGAYDQSHNGGLYDAFLSELSPSGSSLSYSTFLGGTDYDAVNSVAVDASGAAYVTGATSSAGFPTTPGAYDQSHNGSSDAFVTKFSFITFPSRQNLTSSASQSTGPAHRPSLGQGGSCVAFHSPASDLVAGDTNAAGDVFVRYPDGRTERASVSKAASEANGRSTFASVSPDCRYLAFASTATNLVTDSADTNGSSDIYLKDLLTGYVERVSLSSSGEEPAPGKDSRFPHVSADGRYVVFQSEANNLVPGDTNPGWDVFVRDRAARTTERVSVSSSGTQGNNFSVRPAISADGRYVVFHSWASNLVPGDANGLADIYLRDRQAGTTQRVSVSSAGGDPDGESLFAKVSADGRYVVFQSTASNLVPGDTNAHRDVFVRDRQARTTQRVSVSSSGAQADGPSGFASVSSSGEVVCFHSTASNLVSGDANASQDVFVRKRSSSQTVLGSYTETTSFGNALSGSCAISPEGTYIAYHSQASDLVGGDTNGAQDVFLARVP